MRKTIEERRRELRVAELKLDVVEQLNENLESFVRMFQACHHNSDTGEWYYTDPEKPEIEDLDVWEYREFLKHKLALELKEKIESLIEKF